MRQCTPSGPYDQQDVISQLEPSRRIRMLDDLPNEEDRPKPEKLIVSFPKANRDNGWTERPDENDEGRLRRIAQAQAGQPKQG